MLKKFRFHVTGHLVAYVALLSLVLGGTVAQATVPGCGGPCVDSTDIINRAIQREDIAFDAINAARILDGSSLDRRHWQSSDNDRQDCQ